MSLDSFERHAQPELRLIRRGKLHLVPVAGSAHTVLNARESYSRPGASSPWATRTDRARVNNASTSGPVGTDGSTVGLTGGQAAG